MDSGLPLLNCLWQQTLRSFCSSDTSSSSKWVYAVFWRILPRNYPPPRSDDVQGAFDRSCGNKRNWMLVWEDGFCDFNECDRWDSICGSRRFCPEIFFKMSHEVYNYGEGLIGNVAADNNHKWIFRETPSENNPTFFSSLKGSLDSPKIWELQFNCGIQTIAVIAVKEGAIQLGSLDKVVEDLNLVICIQRKFNYLQSIPGVFAMQRPQLAPSQRYMNALRHTLQIGEMVKSKMRFSEEESPSKSIDFAQNLTRNKSIVQPNTPLLPPMSYSLGMLLSRLPCVTPPNKNAWYLNSVENGGFHGQSFVGSCEENTDIKPSIFELLASKPKLNTPYSTHPFEENVLIHSEFQGKEKEQQNDTQHVLN